MSDELKTEQGTGQPEEPQDPKDQAREEQIQTEEAGGAIEEEIDKAAAQEARLTEQMMRLQADFENYKTRSLREKQDIAQYTMESFLKKLLPILDNLDRAQQSADTGNMDAYKQGVDMVFKQLLQVLQDEGLQTVQAEGAQFDPNFHHAVMAESSDDHQEDEVIGELQKGYQYKDKVIRPAMVKVCKK